MQDVGIDGDAGCRDVAHTVSCYFYSEHKRFLKPV